MSSFDFNKSFQSLQSGVSGLSASFQPFAKRTQQMINETLGNAEEKTELPAEYLALEKKIDALKLVHQKLLSVTSNYENEAYDYPPNLKESFLDLSKTIQEKVQGLSQVSSASEAGHVLTAPSSRPQEHKTLSHALARAALAGSQVIGESSSKDEPLSVALDKYAIAESKIGDQRLQQDSLIVNRFNHSVSTTLNSSLGFATKARKNVARARLNLDSIKSAAKVAKPEKHESLRAELEQAEDEFVAATEEAVSVMKNILDNPEPLRSLTELVTAQLAYHKAASEVLGSLAPEIEKLQSDAELSYRTSRE